MSDTPCKKMPISYSWPLDLIIAVERIAQQDNVSPSVASAMLICKALGASTDIVTNGSRKRRSVTSTAAAIQLKQIKLPWPKNLYEIFSNPYRRIDGFYNVFLTLSKRWGVHDPGVQCPVDCTGIEDPKNHPLITPDEFAEVRRLKEMFGVKI